MKLTFNPIDVFMLTQLEDVDLTDNQPIKNETMKEIITIEEQDALDSLVRKLIKSVHEDATESDLDCLVDDFHGDFINYECRSKIQHWNNACQTNNQ